jgi:hypothetical protein
MAYTGNKIQPTLKKVTNDANEFPLDINNNLCSVSGLPQATMPNSQAAPNYIVANSGCNPITYYNVSVLDYFRKNCDNNVGDNILYSLSANQFTSALSQDDANSKALNVLLLQGQINANIVGTCTVDSTCNLPETRAYYKDNCTTNTFPSHYYVALSHNSFCGTQSSVETDTNTWFNSNAQTAANNNGNCVSGDIETIVYQTTGNPCGSLRTATNLYFKAADGKYYTDSARTILANFHFFPTDSLVLGFKQIISGVIQDYSTTYTQCVPSTNVYYQDMGTPADISIYGNNMLACYPNQHVVVKYNLSTGTNPTGVIVAGVLNNVCTGPSMPTYLNTPMLVEWKDDGQKFVVYSGGPFKTLKIFSASGVFFRTTDFSNSPVDSEWAYNTPSGGDPLQYYITPSSTTSLVGLLTSFSTSLDNFWIPVSLNFASRNSSGDKCDDIFIGLWNKTNANINKFKIYAVSMFNYTGSSSNSSTKLVYNNTGYVIPSETDLIRSFKIIKTTVVTSEIYKYKLAIVTPYAFNATGVNNKMRNYDLDTLNVEIAISNSTFSTPTITEESPVFYNSYNHNSGTALIWKNNLKSEINFYNNDLSVVIKSSSNSLWDVLKKSIVYSNIGQMVGSLKALILPSTLTITNVSSNVSNWLANVSPITALGYISSTAIIKTLTTVSTNVFTPPAQRYITSSKLAFTFSGDTITNIVYTPGTFAAQTWISNNIFTPRTLHFNAQGTQGLNTYSLYNGRAISFANWNSSSPASLITI